MEFKKIPKEYRSTIYCYVKKLFDYKKEKRLPVTKKELIYSGNTEDWPHFKQLQKYHFLKLAIIKRKTQEKLTAKQLLGLLIEGRMTFKLQHIQWWKLARFAYEYISPFIIEQSESPSISKQAEILYEYVIKRAKELDKKKIIITKKDVGNLIKRVNFPKALWRAEKKRVTLKIQDFNIKFPQQPENFNSFDFDFEFITSPLQFSILPKIKFQNNYIIVGKIKYQIRSRLQSIIIKKCLSVRDMIGYEEIGKDYIGYDPELSKEGFGKQKLKDSVRIINKRFLEKLNLPKNGPKMIEYFDGNVRLIRKNFE